MSRRVFFPYLDTLRFVAFFLVFGSHVVNHGFIEHGEGILFDITSFILRVLWSGGPEGVHIFFVLSGFLITYLLVEETKETGKVNIIHFYIRRILRIWPLYYLIMALAVLILPHVVPSAFPDTHSKLLALTFLGNFDNVLYAHGTANAVAAVSWSVCVEEQFYLMFPLYFSLVFASRRAYYICSGLIVLSSMTLYYLYDDKAYFNTALNIWFLILGSMGAYLINYDNDRIGIIPFVKKYKVLILLVTVGLYVSHGVILTGFGISVLLGFMYLLVIILLCFGEAPTSKVFNVTNKLGLYTYGMYFYHPLILILVKIAFDKTHLDYTHVMGLTLLMGLLGFIFTVLTAYLSYTYFEKYFLSLKDRFATIITGKH